MLGHLGAFGKHFRATCEHFWSSILKNVSKNQKIVQYQKKNIVFYRVFEGAQPQDGARRGHIGVNLGLSCSMLGHLGAMLGHLGTMLGHLDSILDHVGVMLQPSW